MQAQRQFQPLLQKRYQEVHRDRNPYLRAYRVVRGPVEALDTQMLFDPFEEQFELPATPVELGDDERGHREIVGQKDQLLAGQWIAIGDSPQHRRIVPEGIESNKHHCLIQKQARGLVHRLGVTTAEAEVLFGPRHKEGPAQMQSVEACKIQITAIEYIEAAGLEGQLIEDVA